MTFAAPFVGWIASISDMDGAAVDVELGAGDNEGSCDGIAEADHAKFSPALASVLQ